MASLEAFRSEFPHLESDQLYLDHAAVSPLNRRSRRSLEAYLEDRSGRSIENFSATMDKLARARSRFAELIKAPADRIAIVKNTTDGFLILAHGYPWQPGDRIVLHRREFPSNVYPWYDLKPKGVKIDFLDTPLGRVTPADLAPVVTEKTRLVAVSWVQYLSGYRNDIQALAGWCRERNILLAVDAMQGLGALEFDQGAWGVDFISSGAAKWLMGMQGVGFIYVTKDLQDKLRPPHLGWHSRESFFDFHHYDQPLKADASRFEFATPASPGVWGSLEALELLLDAGPAAIEPRILELTDRLASGLRQADYDVISDRSRAAVKSGIVTFSHPDPSRNPAVHEAMKAKRIYFSLRENLLRVSPHFYNSDAEMERFINGVEESMHIE